MVFALDFFRREGTRSFFLRESVGLLNVLHRVGDVGPLARMMSSLAVLCDGDFRLFESSWPNSKFSELGR